MARSRPETRRKVANIKPIRVRITNVYANGDYTGVIRVGSQKTECNVLLDTGSSALAVDGRVYKVNQDKAAKITDKIQEMQYGDKTSWIGRVVQTKVTMGGAQLGKVPVTVSYHETGNPFGKTQGFLGLAYAKLNQAYAMPGPRTPKHLTYNQMQNAPKHFIEPYFTELETAGLVANKFAFYTRRTRINLATANPANDPLNKGWLILGGGKEQNDLYTGSFQQVRIVHDRYYNTTLKAIIVGKTDPIMVTPTVKSGASPSNCLIDSGSSWLALGDTLFDAVADRLSSKWNTSFGGAVNADFIPMSGLNLSSWPTITFVMEGVSGPDVKLNVSPETYWQTNSPKAGLASSRLNGNVGQPTGVVNLGLPLLNNYYTVFDRSVNKGLGVVSFAKIKAEG
jgi:hypothetical protein